MDISLSEWKNKIIRYLVQSHIGHLFKDGTLEPEQISVDISSGNAHLRQIELDVEFLNEIGDQLNFPLRVVRGYLKELHLHAPWRTFFSDGLSIATEFDGLHLTFEPIEDIDDAASMWSSAIGRLVEKSSTYKNDVENPVLLNEGAKKVDDFFRYLMSKLTIHFKDTVICLQPRNSELGLKLSIKLESLRFYDENEASETVPEQEYDTKNRGAGLHSNTAYTTKIVDIQGVSLWITIPTEDVRSDKQMNEESQIEPEIKTQNEQSQIEPEIKTQNEHEIMFAILSDKQKVKIFMKQTESEAGPGLQVNTTLGDLIIFLTPRQVYLLTEFMREYCETDDIDRYHQKARPMATTDYQRVESILQQQNTQYAGLQMGHGWSSLPTDETEQPFYSMNANHQFDLGCGMSIAGSIDDTSSVHSTIFSERPSTITRMNSRGMTSNYTRAMSSASSCVPRTSHDPGREIFLINIHISSVATTLLHEDILNVTEGGERCTQDSVTKLQELSTTFFESMVESNLSQLLMEDDDEVKRVLDQTCSLNHIRLLSTPVHFSLKVDPQKKEYEGSIKTYRLTLSECLFENNSEESFEIPLLIFEDPLQECLSISMFTRRNYSPRSDLIITLNRCVVELDITIMDRLSALLNLLHSCQGGEQSSIQSRDSTNFVIDIPYAEVKLRFPIPDFTPLHDPNRVPWWKRNIRPDYMTLKCYNAKFHTRVSSQNKSQAEEYSFEFEVMDVYYNEPGRKKPIFVAQIGDKDHKYEPCRFVVKILPTTTLYDVEEREDPATESAFCKKFLQKMDNGPFTSKKIYHQSRSEHVHEAFPDQDFLIPGDRKEIEEFKMNTRDSTKLIIDITLSSVKIQIVSKHTYEMIYNRINNDLLMWEPSAPKSRFSQKKKEVMFEECRSAAQFHHYDSESEDYSDNEDYSLFYSTHEGPKLEEDNSSGVIKKYVDQSNMLIDLKIINGTIAFNPPVRDASSNVIPGQLGYISIDLSEANLFMVFGYKGDSALDYVCVDVKSCDMRHHEMMSSSDVKICLPDLKKIPSHLHPVISKSVGTLVGDRRNQQDRQMLTVAFKILTRHETHHVKTVKIALGLNKSTLHHRVTAEPNSWVSQLIDFFKVTDIPIPGYQSKDVLSEFHLHTWDCAIDYRPLHLPLRCAVTLGSFNMTSNVSEISKGSKLRFLAEDSDLYLSRDNPPKDGIASNIPMDLRREYVNVVTLNMFELSLALNDKNCRAQPSLDLRVSTDCLKIHSCADSLQALTDLIGYIALDGDLTSNEPPETNSVHASPRHGPGDQTLISVEPKAPDVNEISEWERKQINDLLSQAIEDETKEKKFKPATKDKRSPYKYFPQVQSELGDLNALSDDDIESSFVIVDDVHLQKDKSTRVNRLKEPMKINRKTLRFPEVKRSTLKTPSNFPIPVNKYTLCEMNIVWQLYGGRDFLTPQEKKREKKERPLHSEIYPNQFSSTESLYSRYSNSSSPRERRISERDWKDAGGMNRNKDVLMEVVINKLGCQYEVYPKTTLQANRFVLHIKEYEIIDKMKSSEFNKFLCQYISESNPKPTQGHMFSISAVNIRPPVMMGVTECSITFSLLPLRLYIDQESLEFLIKFFTELSTRPDEEKGTVKATSKQSTPLHQPPRLVVTCNKENKEEPQKEGDENLINLDSESTEQRSPSPEIKSSEENSNAPLFFRPVIFASESFVKIDYKGKYVGGTDGSLSGVFMGLIMGLAEINNSEIKLKRIIHKIGILGIDKLFNYIIQEWLNDIKKNQIPKVLIGVGPMQAIVQLLSGFRDLFWLPIEQYQKDGRIVKGLRKGANSFSTSTALAALELTLKFIHLLQVTAETAYDILSPGPSVRQITIAKKKKKRYTQPQDIRQGVTNALWLVKEGIGETAETIAQVAVQEHEQKGYVGVVGGLARQIPPNLIKPIIIASEATNNVLGGIRSQLIPDAKTEANQKYRNFDER